MASFPVPCSDVISPLDDSLLSLRKSVVPKNNDHAGNVKALPRKNYVLVDQLVTVQGDAMLSKMKRIKSDNRNINSVEVKNESSIMCGSKMTILEQQKVKNKMLDDEVSLCHNLEKACFSSTENICGEPRKNVARASEVIGVANNVRARRKSSTNSVKETQVIATSVLDSDTEVKKMQKITIVKTGEHGVSDTKIVATVDAMENGSGKDADVYMLPKDRCHVAKTKVEFVSKEVDCLKLKVGEEASFHEKIDDIFPSYNGKSLVGMKKKPKGSQSDGKGSILGKDWTRSLAGMGRKGKKIYSHDILSSKKKVLNMTSGKDVDRLDNSLDVSDISNGGWNHLEAPSNGRTRDARSNFHVVENDSVLSNSRQINTSGVISSSFNWTHTKCAEDAAAAGGGISEIVPGAASLLENWVCCDICEKWRLLPNGVKTEDLPKKWMCSMLDWLPGMNKCDIDEDVTTGIMRGVIPYSGFENLGYANGSKIGVISSVHHLGQNDANVSTIAMNGRRMSKLGQKEMLKKNKGITVKSRSLNNTSPSLAGCNSLRRSVPENRSPDVNLGENMVRQNENLSIGDKKKIKGKSNQLEFQASKRSKRDDVSNSAKLGSTDIDSCKDISKGCSIGCNSNEVKQFEGRMIVSVKKLSKKTKVSTDCSSMGLKESRFFNVRNLKRSEDIHIDVELHHQPVDENKLMAEENDQCMSKKQKNFGSSDTLIRDTCNRVDNSRPTKEGKAIKKLSSDIRIHFTDVEEEDQPRSKKRKQLAPRQANSSSSKVSCSQKSIVNYEVQGSPVESISSSPLRVANSAKFSSVPHDVLIRADLPNGVLPVLDNVGVGCGGNTGVRQSGIVVDKESCGFHMGSLEPGTLQKDSKPFSQFRNDHNLDRATDYPQRHEFHVSNMFHMSSGYKKSGNALCLQKNGNLSLKSNVMGRNSESDFDEENVRTLEAAVEKVSEQSGGRRYEYLVKGNHAPPFGIIQNHMDTELAKKKVKNHASRDLPNQNKHVPSDGGINTLYSDYGLESPSEHTCPDSDCRLEAVQVSAESISKEMLPLRPGGEGNHGASSRDSQLGCKRNIYNRLPVDTASNMDLSKTLVRRKRNGTSNMECLTCEIDVKDMHSSNSPRACQFVQTASAVLKEAEKLRDLADRLKGTNFGFEGNESYFEAAVKFLQAASLLERSRGENNKHREVTPLQIYSTAAKFFESCAAEFERCQELSAATLAYKCMEVAYMRIVNCKYGSLRRDRNELQATLQQGESPSSSASDIDNINNQAVVDRFNLSKGSSNHFVGNHIVVARNLPSFVRLLDFTQEVNLAMEASRKSQVAFLASNGSMKGSQNKELIITSLKMVIDFSFQDVDGLINLVLAARKAISRSGFTGTKD
ncbi:hypothetical protein SAY86_008056 [Trapa natans]|uniref:CW-type domain-containing protein n=1 Tax=Trapa natans TaxID=22666 RepID=A0AAN7LQ55_TRANT|nr:hypothetical protein SAY86_008056 [Trapa natans]